MTTNATQSPRRHFLKTCSAACLAGAAGVYPALLRAAEIKDAGPLAPQPTHFEPRAKHLIFVFLTGGFSHVDTFDHKPKLAADAGKTVNSFGLRSDEAKPQPLMGSPFKFQARGESGLEI